MLTYPSFKDQAAIFCQTIACVRIYFIPDPSLEGKGQTIANACLLFLGVVYLFIYSIFFARGGSHMNCNQ